MNNFLKQIIEERFESKKQQKYFYSKANDESLSPKERKKWAKWAKEFSNKTNFKKLPNKKEKDVDEVVDEKGNIERGKIPTDFNVKGVTDNWTTDEVAKAATGAMGVFGSRGGRKSVRFWGESDMSKALGYEDTLGQDDNYEKAKKYFHDELGITDPQELEDRLKQMGYDPKLPDDKVRLVENPKKFIEEYIDSLLNSKTKENDILTKDEEKEINPIVLKQIKSLKNSMNSHNISIKDILKHLDSNE